MGDLFTDGQQASRAVFWEALTALRSSGQVILDDLTRLRSGTLLAFEQGLSSLNGRRQRTNRLLSPDIAGQFTVSDLLDVDQTLTSATLRADSQAVTLRHRKNAPPAVVQSQTFTVNEGTVQEFGNLFQVYLNSGNAPTGTFLITFSSPVDLTLLVFDLVLTPSNPTLVVQVSNDGVYFKDALQITRSGARVSAYLPEGDIRYLRLAITPSMPDNLGGYTYTFGLAGFYPYQVAFHLESQYATTGVAMYPSTVQLEMNFVEQPGVTAFVSFDGVNFTAVEPGAQLTVPGAVAVTGNGLATVDPSTGILSWSNGTSTISTLPGNLYARTLAIFDSSGNPMTVAQNLDPGQATLLTKPVFAWWNNHLYYRPLTGSPGTFSVSYVSGPAVLYAYLRVQLVSRDRADTPIFSGMTLNNVY